MRDSSIQPGGLHTGILLRIFAGLSAVFLVVLAAAPTRHYFSEWRSIQERYNRLAGEAGAAGLPVGIQQIWRPELGITDRCITCHVAMGTAQPAHGDPLFRAHPPIPHDPRQFGCTVCHGGQGRATSKDAAHGFVSHWDQQLLEKPHTAAGCGTCHNTLPLISRSDLARGRRQIESLDCLSCHRLEGQGRGKAVDLSAIGIKGFKTGWHAWHLEQLASDTTGGWKSSYGPIADADLQAIEAFLKTRVGAPRIVEAQALAFEKGCLGCHKIAGRGGDEGPVLDEVGRKPIGDLSFSRVAGERTLVNYLRRHFQDPATVVAGSLMPAQAATEEEADLLTAYSLYLRGRGVPPEYMPKDRARRELLGVEQPPLTGAQAFGAFCAGCHGSRGEGRNYGNLDVRFPAIGSPDFLELASDSYIESTLMNGRPGRRMPALGAPGGSLSGPELKGIVAYLRSMQGPPTSASLGNIAAVPAGQGDAFRGKAEYDRRCAGCHGSHGEGKFGPALGNAAFLKAASAQFISATILRGRAGTPMPAFGRDSVGYPRLSAAEVLDITEYIRTGLAAKSSQ